MKSRNPLTAHSGPDWLEWAYKLPGFPEPDVNGKQARLVESADKAILAVVCSVTIIVWGERLRLDHMVAAFAVPGRVGRRFENYAGAPCQLGFVSRRMVEGGRRTILNMERMLSGIQNPTA